MEITTTISDDGEKVLKSWLGEAGIKDWLQHAIDNKLRQRVDASILEHTNLNPQKMTKDDKLIKLSKIELPTREMRDGKKDEIAGIKKPLVTEINAVKTVVNTINTNMEGAEINATV